MNNILGNDYKYKRQPLKYLVSTQITDGPHETPTFIESDGVPFLSVDAIVDGQLIVSDERLISHKDAKLYGRKCQPKYNDILVGKAASTGKVARVKTNQYFSVWSPLAMIRADNNKIDSTYLEYYLKSNLGQEQMDLFANVNTQKNIGMKDLERVQVLVPKLEDQKNIADYLDKKISAIDLAIKNAGDELENLHFYKEQLVFGYLKNVKGKMYRLQDVCIMKKGPFGSAITREMFVDKSVNTYKVYEQGNAIRKTIEYGDYYITKGKFMSLSSFEIKPFELIISCAGTIGEIFEMPANSEKGIINQALMKVKCNSELILNRYFIYFWSSQVKETVLKESNGSAIKNIPPFSVLDKIKINLPSLDEQEQIITYLDEKCNLIDKLLLVKQKKLETLKEYKKSLIYECVAGKKEVC